MILTELSTLMAFAGGWILPGPLFLLLLIAGILFLVRSRSGRSPWTGGGRETGIDVLERRFAEGELSLEQYRERRSVLSARLAIFAVHRPAGECREGRGPRGEWATSRSTRSDSPWFPRSLKESWSAQ
jgi:hypothetical protein